jgi:glucose repression regulatory protein TUP1
MTTLYDAVTGDQIVQLPDETGSRSDNYIRSVAFSPDGKLLATGSEDKIIRLWNLERRAIVKKLEGHTSEIYSLAFTPDGKDIISGSGDKSARIWDLESGTVKHEMSIDEARINEQTGQPLDGGVTSVAISFDGELLAAGSLDHVVRIWDIKSGRLLDKLKGHRDSVYSVAFIPAGKGNANRSQILTGSLDKTLKVWDLTPLRTAMAEGKSWDANEGRTPCLQSLAGHKVSSASSLPQPG